DSLIGKLIIADESRDEAIIRAQNALKELVILGFPTNISFFDELFNDSKFQQGDISINFIKDRKILEKLEKNVCAVASVLFAVGLKKSEMNLPPLSENWQMKGKMESTGRD
ncbi:MAG: hypothetical protein FK733_15160, partial [Asgard group archaeon]|nr:hypothetical protein [Asgard group archaeon]